jgi:hypothetical protein
MYEISYKNKIVLCEYQIEGITWVGYRWEIENR